MLRNGETLSAATQHIAEAWKLPFTLIPMSDDPVATMVHTTDGRELHFQEWWVGERAASPVTDVVLDGGAAARPAPAAIKALEAADLVILCPSNPVVSIGTILQIAGIRARLVDRPVVGVSPIVGGTVVRGMADKLLPVVGAEVSAAGVAGLYRDFLDGWVIDTADAGVADPLRRSGLDVAVTDTIMSDVEVTTALARTTLELAVKT